jgi:hypothetical protein
MGWIRHLASGGPVEPVGGDVYGAEDGSGK